MRFEVRYPSGASHDVDIDGPVATVGRDPTSDLVLNDPKCSRRHAVLETGPDGLAIRDSGSANGIFINGKKVERAALNEGDVIKMGDVVVRVLGEGGAGTLVLPDLDAAGMAPAPSPPRVRPPVPPAVGADLPTVLPSGGISPYSDPVPPEAVDAWEAAPPARGGGKALFVRTLAVLWGLSVPVLVVAGFAMGWSATGAARAVIVLITLILAGLAIALAYGLWRARPWARGVQIGGAAFGLFVCPFTLAAIAVLVYMLRPEGRRHFSPRREAEGADEKNDLLFTGALLGAVVLALLLTAAATFFARTARTRAADGGALDRPPTAAEAAAAAQLRTLATSEEAFHGVCNTGYGDLAALRHPATVIERYPPDGPAFLRDDAFDEPERGGYRFTLRVEDEMPDAPGCPKPRFRRFQYSATPISEGRHLVIGPDLSVRAADGRPARPEDPPL